MVYLQKGSSFFSTKILRVSHLEVNLEYSVFQTVKALLTFGDLHWFA